MGKQDEWLFALDQETIGTLKKENERLEGENNSLRGFVRRLEKSNQELGEENHRLKGNGEGWNKTQ